MWLLKQSLCLILSSNLFQGIFTRYGTDWIFDLELEQLTLSKIQDKFLVICNLYLKKNLPVFLYEKVWTRHECCFFPSSDLDVTPMTWVNVMTHPQVIIKLCVK